MPQFTRSRFGLSSTFQQFLCALTLIAFTSAVPAWAQQQPPADPAAINATPLAQTWSSPRLQISYTPPSGYREIAKVPRSEVTFQGAETDSISATVALQMIDTHGMALEELATSMADVIKSAVEPDQRVTAKLGSRDSDGNECFRIDTLGTGTTAKSRGHQLQMRLLFINHGGKTFNFIFTAAPSVFVAEATAFERSITSIRWSVPIPAEKVNLTDIGVLMTIPENWRRVDASDPDAIPGVPFVVFGPTVDGYHSNILMVLATMSPGVTELPADAAQKKAAIEAQTRDNYHYVAQTRVSIDGVPALVLDAAFQYPQTHKSGQSRIVMLVRGGQMYTFQMSTSAAGFDASVQAAFAAFMNSIHWVKPGTTDTTAPEAHSFGTPLLPSLNFVRNSRLDS